ncbi:MAG: DUF1499 domain-containing protein [bacterium]|nr:DUF1499 domain-containing protein [bacterium]
MAAAAPKLSLIALALALVGLLGAYLGFFSPMAGFQTFVAGTLLGGFFCTALALIGLVLTRGGRDPAGHTQALVGLSIALGLLIVVLAAASTGGDAPPINDITTDLTDPPAFADNALVPEYAGRDMSYPAEFVAIVRKSYPDLEALRVDVGPTETFARAVAAAEGLGWEVVAKDAGAGAFYAHDVSAIFRFVDDVVVRIRPDGSGARIDVRSKSRDGRGDLGANATRIRAFFAELG